MDHRNWNRLAAEALRQQADAIAATVSPELIGEREIAFADLLSTGGDVVDDLTRSIEVDRGIYILSFTEEVDPALVRETLLKVRAEKSADLRLPQLNPATKPGGGDEAVLYVGSSCATGSRKKTIASRLKQHLIQAPRGTYALNLAQWATVLPGGIVLRVYNYPADTDRSVVVAVEDQLSEMLAPMCGRRGIQR